MTKEDAALRVLLVDDHPMIRIGLAQLLSEVPEFEVCGEAKDAEEAMALIAKTEPDVVVADISLGRDSGLTLIQDIKRTHKSTRVVVYSMHDEMLYAPRSIQAGAMGYVGKNANPTDLIEAIRQVARGRLSVSPRVAEEMLSHFADVKTEAGQDPVESLSNRELHIFEMLGRGITVAQIATQLERSVKTIETHRERIIRKLGLSNTAELMRRAVEWVVEKDR